LAALMWSVIGTLLAAFGCRWIYLGLGPLGLLLTFPCVILGELKAHFILRRAAARIITRIAARGDGRCIGGFLSLRTWGFVLLMMFAGYWLRRGLLPRVIVGLLYVAVGIALASASRQIWGAWNRLRAPG